MTLYSGGYWDLPIDTQVSFLDYRRGIIEGYIDPFADSDHLVKPGKSNGVDHLPHQGAHYITPATTLAVSKAEGCPLFADHHYEVGAVGYVTHLGHDERGIRIKAQLLPSCKEVWFETPRRTLPKLLRAGKLYFCASMLDPVIRADGWLEYGIMFEVSLTEHPAVPKRGKRQ